MGFYRLDVPVGHPDFGQAQRCHCQRAGDQLRRRRASNLGGELLQATFEGFDLRVDNRDAHAALQAFGEEPMGWIVLLGEKGTGKTHLMAAAANRLMLSDRSDHAPLYVVVPDFLGYVREGFDADHLSESAARRMREAMEAPVLFLDDLGAEKRTPWTDEQIFILLNYRYIHQLPTVISSNCRLEELEERVASRMRDGALSQIIVMTGQDQRPRRRRRQRVKA